MRLPISGRSSTRDHPLVLDRQIRDAAPRIEPVGRRKRRRRAGIEAAPAGAAVIGLRGIGLELEAQIDLAEEQPGAELPRDQIGVLALPAEPGALGERLFHDRRGIDKELQRARPALLDPMRERLQAALQGVVIIAPARIDRNDAAIGSLSASASGSSSGAIIDAEHDDAARLGPQRLRIAAPRRGAGEPTHVAVIAARDELAEPGARLGVEPRLGKTDRIKAGGERPIADRLADRVGHPPLSRARDRGRRPGRGATARRAARRSGRRRRSGCRRAGTNSRRSAAILGRASRPAVRAIAKVQSS